MKTILDGTRPFEIRVSEEEARQQAGTADPRNGEAMQAVAIGEACRSGEAIYIYTKNGFFELAILQPMGISRQVTWKDGVATIRSVIGKQKAVPAR